jgi:amino acid transporter
MPPILNGTAVIVLLSFSIGLGVYIRAVFAATTETYDKTITGEHNILWPPNAPYTIARLRNLRDVQKNLMIVTKVMFLFVFLVAARLIVFALNATPWEASHISNATLSWIDLFLVVYLAIALIMSFFAHLRGSKREREQHEAAYNALPKKPS